MEEVNPQLEKQPRVGTFSVSWPEAPIVQGKVKAYDYQSSVSTVSAIDSLHSLADKGGLDSEFTSVFSELRTPTSGVDVCPLPPAPFSTSASPSDIPSRGLCSTFGKPVQESAEPEVLFDTRPSEVLAAPEVPYIHFPDAVAGRDGADARVILEQTPLPKGVSEFSSVHVVALAPSSAQSTAWALVQSVRCIGKQCDFYSWPTIGENDHQAEWDAFYNIASKMIRAGADRASLLIVVSPCGGEKDLAAAAILGMLPFRGVQVAFLTARAEYIDPLGQLSTASGLFEYCASQPERMGRCSVAAVFGPLTARTFSRPIASWKPLRPEPLLDEEKPAPFKIGAMELPMVTFEGRYEDGVQRLAELLCNHFGNTLFPVVAVGETGDALGHGTDVLEALENRGCSGFYFAHASGESFKRPDAYGKPELLQAIAKAKSSGRRVVVVAVGGGVNGNAMGMVAAMTGSYFIEVPTTLMHYNDATTSAKKAFSLVVDGHILSKNILGTFYLPQLVFCISQVFLTLSSASVHAAVGESAKTMGMLGKANSAQGRMDFHNIFGGSEFASDFTRIVRTAPGFERLIQFLARTQSLKNRAIAAGQAIARGSAKEGRQERTSALTELRRTFSEDMSLQAQRQVTDFLTAVNEEVIKAKAMFLAYSDPFEKYRALLFEYAHTLGHGVEAYMNGLYRRALALGIEVGDAFRLHGQCVGMAVVWAGEMSKDLGHLDGDGYLVHQALVFLFNGFGGFDFGPIRRLCDQLDVSCDEFCEGVLRVVRRDNKRGYCQCSPGSSVDQLVRGRPGCLLRSEDPNAELRYLVEVGEDAQRAVLERAFAGEFDQTLVCSPEGSFQIVKRELCDEKLEIEQTAAALDAKFVSLYASCEY